MRVRRRRTLPWRLVPELPPISGTLGESVDWSELAWTGDLWERLFGIEATLDKRLDGYNIDLERLVESGVKVTTPTSPTTAGKIGLNVDYFATFPGHIIPSPASTYCLGTLELPWIKVVTDSVQWPDSDSSHYQEIVQSGADIADNLIHTLPAATGTLVQIGDANTWTAKQTFSAEIEVDAALNHDGTAGFFGSAPVAASTGWTVGTVTEDKTMVAAATITVEQLADFVGTVANRLISLGLIQA